MPPTLYHTTLCMPDRANPTHGREHIRDVDSDQQRLERTPDRHALFGTNASGCIGSDVPKTIIFRSMFF